MTIRLLDGGLGQELRRRSATPDHPLWSARQMLDEADLVQAVHEDFLRAGAEIITTNTYATTRWRLRKHGEDHRFAQVNRAACAAAIAARDAAAPLALIAGSLGPSRGSYVPERVAPISVIEPEYAELALLLAPDVDLFLCETMTTADEAFAAARAATSTGRPVWVSFTLEDAGPPRLRSGETIAAAVDRLAELTIDAFLINCTTPEAVTAGLPQLRAATQRPVGAYANGFVAIPEDFGDTAFVKDLATRCDLGPDDYAKHAARWIEAGATIIGGCCEVGPAHIARLRTMIGERA